MKYIIFLLFNYAFGFLQAQVVHGTEVESGEKGRHYRFPEFREGEVVRKEGNLVKASLNYNLATEEIIVDLGHSRTPYGLDNSIEKIIIDGVEFLPRDGIIYERLSEDAISLLVHRKQIVSRLGQNTGLGRSGSVNSKELPPDKGQMYELVLPGAFEYKDINMYFIAKGDEFSPLRKLKDLESIFPEYDDDLKTYIKSERVKMHKEEDLIKLITYCNSMIK
jgi:hypothetical protein